MRILTLLLTLLLVTMPGFACFGPKLFIGTPAGEKGELLFHLAALYIHEKTGVESKRFEFNPGQGAEQALQLEQVDLAFSFAESDSWQSLLQIDDQFWLLSGPRPTEDLQFTTVPRTLEKLQRLLTPEDLENLQTQVAQGDLPATAVRKLYMERSWI